MKKTPLIIESNSKCEWTPDMFIRIDRKQYEKYFEIDKHTEPFVRILQAKVVARKK